jgi:transcription elongation factor
MFGLNDDYEIIGWVWLTTYGELKANGVNVKKGDGQYFIYNNKKYPPGVYYLIRYRGREYLISERTLKSL